MTPRTLGIVSLFALSVGACSKPADDSNIAIDENVNAAEAANAEIETLPPSETPGDNGNAAVNEAEDDSESMPPAALIPAQYRGRWGIVAADCEPGRSDAKGLMTIRETSIKFYESVANLQEQRPAIATSFSGVFTFEGEGQTWERVITLTRTGDMLKRAQADANYTYKRCT